MNPKLSLLIGILSISFSPIFVKFAVSAPVVVAFYRMLIALLILFPYCLFKGKLKAPPKPLAIALAGGVIFGADIAVWNISLTLTSTTISTLIANLSPLWVGILSFLILKQNAGRLFWIGATIALTGIIILAGYQNVLALKLDTGILLALLSSLLYAVFLLMTKSVLKSINSETFVFYNLVGAAVFLFIVACLQQNNLVSFSTITWLCFLALGIICQLTGWLTITHALNYLPSTKVSMALLSRAVIASFWAFLLLHERIGAKEIIGSLLVLAGIAVTFLSPKKAIV